MESSNLLDNSDRHVRTVFREIGAIQGADIRGDVSGKTAVEVCYEAVVQVFVDAGGRKSVAAGFAVGGGVRTEYTAY